jgi:peptidoglycan/LPS O-acetylase OafA/YrhL
MTDPTEVATQNPSRPGDTTMRRRATRSGTTGSGERSSTLALDRQEIRQLTGLRLFAAAWVVLFHFQFTHGSLLARVLAPAFPVVTTGAMGVDLFFVLSGFVIAFTYLDRLGPRWRTREALRFIWARVCRIWPAYALVTTLFMGFLLFKRAYWSIESPAYQKVQPVLSARAWLRQLTLTEIWNHPWHDGVSFVGPAWSVSAEFFAYVLFPLAGLLLYRLGRLPRWALAVLAVALMLPESVLCLLTGSPYFPFCWLARIGGGFISGVLVYLVVRDIPRTPRVRRIAARSAGALLVLVLAGLLLGTWLGPGSDGVATERGGMVLALFPPLIGALSLGSGWLVRGLSCPVAVHGGRISYSLYLIHVPVFEVWWTAMERVGILHPNSLLGNVLTPLVFVGVFVLAHLLFALVEEPARRAMRRFAPRATPASR